MSAITYTQRDFVSRYVQLLGLANPLTPDNFNSVSDYSKVQSLGPSLPKVTTPLPTMDHEEGKVESVKITFKSIKPPFKFTSTFTDYSSANSIYKTKLDLIESLPELKNGHVAPKHIKLLLKGKVLQDLSLLSTLKLDQDLSFTCMVATPDHSEIEQQNATSESLSETKQKSPIAVLAETWGKILQALQTELSTEDANETINKFKNSLV